MSTKSIAKTVRQRLNAIPEGEVFGYRSFGIDQNKEQALAQTLSRLTQSGKIVRVEKGKYYKPRNTRFGTLRPAESEIIKTLTVKNNQVVGYLTGITLYNQLGLTTQVSNTLVIARNSRLPVKEINGYKIRFITKTFKFKKEDIFLLQLLDAIRDIKAIPDSSVEKSITILVGQMKRLTEEEIKRMSKLAMKYNPATRALLGAMLEKYFSEIPVSGLFKSLNPLSKYKLNVSNTVLSGKSKWYIE